MTNSPTRRGTPRHTQGTRGRMALTMSIILISTILVALQWSRNSAHMGTGVSPSDTSTVPTTAQAGTLKSWEIPWYSTQVKCVIVAPDAFTTLLKEYAANKTARGVPTVILNISTINANATWTGRDQAETIHNALRDYYLWYGIEYVILAGSTDQIPIRLTYNDDTVQVGQGTHEDVGSTSLKPTDYYYADLIGSDWDEDKDGYWGESSKRNANGVDEIDWTPEVAVGRLPAQTTGEMETLLEKLSTYENLPKTGDWMNTAILAGAISDMVSESPPDGEDEAWLTNYIKTNYIIDQMIVKNLYDSTSGYTPDPNANGLSKATFGAAVQAGASIVIFGGHGTTDKLSEKIGVNNMPELYGVGDINTYLNTGTPSFFWASACTTNPYDQYGAITPLGRTLLLTPGAGAIGYVGALRVSWYFEDDTNLEMLNRGMTKLFWKNFFVNQIHEPGKALNAMRVEYLNSSYFTDNMWVNMTVEYDRKNVLTYNLLGDPEMPIRTRAPCAFAPQLADKNATKLGTQFYEGQLVTVNVKDANGKIAYNSRVTFRGDDGAYYSASNGMAPNVSVRLPLKTQNYSITVTGPDMNPFTTEIEVEEDNYAPICDTDACTIPTRGTIDEPLFFRVKATDSESGVASVLLNFSSNSGDDYEGFEMTGTNDLYQVELPLVPDGDFSFNFVVTDYAENVLVVQLEGGTNFKVVVPAPPLKYGFLIGTFASIVGLVVVGSMLTVNTRRALKKDDLERDPSTLDGPGSREIPAELTPNPNPSD